MDQGPGAGVIAAAVRMRDLGLAAHTTGNVSARVPGGMLITPTRRYPEDLGAGDLVEVPLTGPVGGEPSLEWAMHAAIYLSRPDVHAVVHTHSPHATARSFDPAPLIVLTEERVYLGLERIEVAALAESGTQELAAAAVAALGNRDAALLARHGVVGVGADPREALEICAVVEQQATIDSVLNANTNGAPSGTPFAGTS
ncbi:MAG: L-fuculose-phosphate aldolase [Thermoleophilaceae bacterium]|jgi:L-fuculose-phosphate aldolase|nr:L-fuculose-phosphate aldolase [Thermoleophilaceae bacterium]